MPAIPILGAMAPERPCCGLAAMKIEAFRKPRLVADCQQPAGTSVSEQDEQADSFEFLRMVMNTAATVRYCGLVTCMLRPMVICSPLTARIKGRRRAARLILGWKNCQCDASGRPLPDITVGEFDAQSGSLARFSGILCLG